MGIVDLTDSIEDIIKDIDARLSETVVDEGARVEINYLADDICQLKDDVKELKRLVAILIRKAGVN